MKSTVLVIQLVLLGALCSVIFCENSHGPSLCCFDFYPKRLPIKALATYKYTSSECLVNAVIFITRAGLEICVEAKRSWVKKHVKILDNLSKVQIDESLRKYS